MQNSNQNVLADEQIEILNLINAGKNITVVYENLGTIRFMYDPEDEILLLNTAIFNS